MYDDPRPEDTVRGGELVMGGHKLCTVAEFDAMTEEEREAFNEIESMVGW